MKAIIIDVIKEEIREVDIPQNNLDAIYQQLNCSCFDIVGLSYTESLYVDDEGLLKLNDNSKFFAIKGAYQPFVGNGLILGIDYNTGESINTSLTIEYVKSIVTFHTINEIIKDGHA
jgi:hypothetical protein